MLAEVAQTEQIAEQPARGSGDDNRPRLGQGLKARCKVRRIPDHCVLAQRTLAAEVANHHQAGRDADADRERFPACVSSRATAAMISSPARTVRSASSSCAIG